MLSETFVRREVEALASLADVDVRALHPQPVGNGESSYVRIANAHLNRTVRVRAAARRILLRPREARQLARGLAGCPSRWRTWLRLLAAAPTSAPDHVHTHFASSNAIAARAFAQATGSSFGVTLHAHDIFAPSPRALEATAAADLLVTVCDFNRRYIDEHLPALTGRSVVTVRSGIPAENVNERTRGNGREKPPVVVSVGRLVPKKGFDTLLEAFARVRLSQAAQLRIVGEGPQRDLLERRARELGVRGHVSLLGAEPNEVVLEELRRCSVFALACRREERESDALPVVLMEAMATGALVVTTPVAGIPELVEDGVTGFVAEDSGVDAVARALERALGCRDAEAIRGRALERIRAEYLLETNIGRLASEMSLVVGARRA